MAGPPDLHRLFRPGNIGRVRLNNRIVLAPLDTGYAKDGAVTPEMVRHYARRARGGAGLLIVEVASVEPGGGSPRELVAGDDRCLPGLRQLTDAVKANGSKCVLQLGHAGAQISARLTGRQPVAPSAIPDPVIREMPAALDEDGIQAIVSAFARAAALAREAGFDGVELHGAHGYLLGQFLSPATNQRTDAYGGSFEGRFRFVREVLTATRRAVGPDLAVIFRLSAVDHVPGGLALPETVEIARELERTGVDAIDVSAGRYATLEWIVPPMSAPRGVLVPYAAAVKAVVDIPVIAVGRINDPQLAEHILAQGKADFIAMGRPLLADPDLPAKAKDGRLAEIRMCTACNDCFVSSFVEQKPLVCAVNPEVGREGQFDYSPAGKPLRVVVVGGGPAGMEAAWVARRRGHPVILLEAQAELGGHLRTASRVASKAELRTLLQFQLRQMQRWGVDVRTSVRADRQLIDDLAPDAVVVATGARPVLPDIPGVDLGHVMMAEEVLENRRQPQEGVVILGGSGTGCEVAEYLLEQGMTEIYMLVRGKRIGHSLEPLLRRHVRRQLHERGVKIILSASVEKITETGVHFRRAGGEQETIAARAVVVARGYAPNAELQAALEGGRYKVYSVGDCEVVRDIRHAIHAAHSVATLL